MDYMHRLNQALVDNNRKAFLYRDGKAWDNRKAKTQRLLAPRGKVFERLESLEFKKILGLL